MSKKTIMDCATFYARFFGIPAMIICLGGLILGIIRGNPDYLLLGTGLAALPTFGGALITALFWRPRWIRSFHAEAQTYPRLSKNERENMLKQAERLASESYDLQEPNL